MIAHGADPVVFDDVKDEIFDMIRPAHPSRITLQVITRNFILSLLSFIKNI